MSENLPVQQENSDSESSPGNVSDNDDESLSVHPPFEDDEDDNVDVTDTKIIGNPNEEALDSDISIEEFNVTGMDQTDNDSLSSHGSLSLDAEGQNTDEEDEDEDEEVEEDDNDDDDDDEDEDEEYLQKLDKDMIFNHVATNHPESLNRNYDEVRALCNVIRDSAQNVIDPLHRTIPILTKYEYAHVIGLRATQIDAGSHPFVEIDKNIVEGHLIAQIEVRQKKVPFIIRRPIPGGGAEYWRLSDLEILF